MNMESRICKSLLNMTGGVISRLLSILAAFIVRTAFIHCLSSDYLGINGVYSSILSVLSLADLGFGTAMVYSMYSPLAQKDYIRLSQLMLFYKRAYRIVGVTILSIGLMLVPFLKHFVVSSLDMNNLVKYYLLFLGDTVISYLFFSYRNSILQADQRAYIISAAQSVSSVIKSIGQIIVLFLFRNYTIYLLVQIGCTILQNCVLAYIAYLKYPVFKGCSVPLPESVQKSIYSDVKALALSKISFVALNSTDTLIVSALFGVNMVGLLSNYTMIVEAATTVLSQVIGGLSASLGNYFAKENNENSYKMFCRIEFMNFWLYSFCAIIMITLLNPFITLWLGEAYTLNSLSVIALVTRFFVSGIMNMLSTFRSSLGLFVQGKLRPLAAAAMNIVLSILLGMHMGISGVLFATVITRLCVNLWFSALIIHRDGFSKSVKPYYVAWLGRILVVVIITVLMMFISRIILLGGVTYLSFGLLVLLAIVIPNVILVIYYHRNEDYRYYVRICKDLFGNI